MTRSGPIDADFLFALFEVQRLLRLYADKQASQYGLTRTQWAVLAKVNRTEGLKQAEIAEMLEIQPITLTRLIDKLCSSGLLERRSDATDRRINRLYLTKAARPLMAKLAALRSEVVATACTGFSHTEVHRLVEQLETIKDNVRDALQTAPSATKLKERRYG
ncbi:MAG: MarR family transcriptional regulator [Rhizobiales bacterium]|nr:MarR family transcriptional regulator [Hyphomicrobiales bacterium]